MGIEPFPDPLEGVTLGRKRQHCNCPITKNIGDGDVGIRFVGPRRCDGDRKCARSGQAQDEIGPMAQIAEYAPAFPRIIIPMVRIEIMADNKKTIHPRSRFPVEVLSDNLPEAAARAVEAQEYFPRGLGHRLSQPIKLLLGNHVRFFNVDMFSAMQRLDGVFRMSGMVGGNVYQSYCVIIEYFIEIGGEQRDMKVFGERGRAVDIRVHAGADDAAEPASQEIGDGRECVIAAADKSDDLLIAAGACAGGECFVFFPQVQLAEDFIVCSIDAEEGEVSYNFSDLETERLLKVIHCHQLPERVSSFLLFAVARGKKTPVLFQLDAQ